MEVLRGIVAISFGLIFIFIDVRFFIYVIGIYLIIDCIIETSPHLPHQVTKLNALC